MSKKRKKALTIGILPGWQAYTGSIDTFLDHVFRGILSAANDLDCNLYFGCGVGHNYGKSLGRPAWPVQSEEVDFIPVGPWNCDGLIIIPPFATDTGRVYFQGLVDSGYPIVFAGSVHRGPGVVADNKAGVRQALLHLIQHGHQQIAFISGRDRDDDSDSTERLRSYKQVLMEVGIPVVDELIVSGNHTYEGGREAIEILLLKKNLFTAVLASNDQSAVGAMDALRDRGLLVPHDIAVIGFDDRLEAKSQVPLLTTVRFPMFEMGYQALHYVFDRIAHPDSIMSVKRIPTHLVIRESCGCTHHSALTMLNPSKKKILSEANIYQDVAYAIYKETQRFTLAEISYLCGRLMDALLLSLRSDDPHPFTATMYQVLDYASREGEDLYAWQNMVTTLRERKDEICKLVNCKDPEKIIALLDSARVQISEVTRGHSSKVSIQRSFAFANIGQLTSQLFTVKSENEIFSALAENLPLIGISSTVIGIYENPTETPHSDLELLYSTNTRLQRKKIKCTAKNIIPVDSKNNANSNCHMFVPIHMGENSTGFVSFETRQFDFTTLIAQQIASAMQGVHLYREVSHARRLAENRRKLAEDATRLKSRFLSIVSHELRTPLNLITGLTDIILQENDPSLDLAQVTRLDLERIQVSAQHLDGLIRDVLDLTKLDIGQLRLSWESFPVDDVIQASSLVGKKLTEDKNLEWICRVEPNLPHVWGDRTRLQQVLINLINNAVKFTSHGSIQLICEIHAGSIVISLQDSGVGIPDNEKTLIFEEFHQTERTIKQGFGGLGLGLAICKKIVELHGGEIGVCSDGYDQSGSTFYFTIPAFIENQEDLNRFTDFYYSKNLAVLLFDEEPAAFIHQYLQNNQVNFSTFKVHHGSGWFNRVVEHNPDAILVDHTLLNHQANNILKVLKENLATKNIALNFFASRLDREKSYSSVSFDLKSKPLDGVEINQFINELGINDSTGGFHRLKVLLVDDEPDTQNLHARILHQYNPDILISCAANGLEALMMLRQQLYDLVILDLNMPDLDGFSVMELMQYDEKLKNVPVIIVTNQYLSNEDVARLTTGVATVLNKRVLNEQEISDRIFNVIEGKRQGSVDPLNRVLNAISYIHSHYSEPITRAQLAGMVGLSERHLDRCFQQELGVTPIVYLNRYRIRCAKDLLEKGGRGITEIALAVGFSSSGYFSRVFKEDTGIPPSKYIRKNNSMIPS
jgi:signal transduction histidine kinase/DNA-binding LacI/PurR family transcriptional regulator/AraC-like DNA-binding protein